MTLPLFPIEAEDPFGATPDANASLPPREEGHIRVPGDHLDVLRSRMASGTDADTQAASAFKGAGKGRKRQPNFKPYAKAYYEARGQTWENKETAVWIEGCTYPMKVDYLGIFDGVVKPGADEVGVQLCNKEGVTSHIRKMMSLKRGYGGIRRKNLLKWWADGKTAVILYFFQPGGKGTKWECKEREVTREDLEIVIAGGRLKLDG